MVVVPRLPAFSVRNIAHTIRYYYNAKTVVNQLFINSVCLAVGGEQTGKWSSLGRRSRATNKQKRKPVPSSVGLHCDCAQMHRTRQTASRTDHIPSVSISPVNRPPHSHPTHTHTPRMPCVRHRIAPAPNRVPTPAVHSEAGAPTTNENGNIVRGTGVHPRTTSTPPIGRVGSGSVVLFVVALDDARAPSVE